MILAISTGFFVKELLALQWDHDVDLDAGTATLAPKATSLRRRRTKTARLPPLAVEYLRKLPRASARVFGWQDDKQQLDLPALWLNDDRAGLWSMFRDIQARAGINLACDREHRHTKSCRVYGFDDLRSSSEPYCRAEILARVDEARRAKRRKA